MTRSVQRRWTPPCETTLPALEGLLFDIEATVDYLAHFLDGHSYPRKPQRVLDALAEAAVIRYARPFGNGRRGTRNVTDLLRFTSDEKALHEKIYAIRSKHVAHPVNGYEAHDIYVSYHDGDEPLTAQAVHCGSFASGALSPKDALDLMTLCQTLRAQAFDLIQKETSRLLPLAKMLSPSELRSLPDGPSPLSENPKKDRKSVG